MGLKNKEYQARLSGMLYAYMSFGKLNEAPFFRMDAEELRETAEVILDMRERRWT